MHYDENQFLGMHVIACIIWVSLIVWVFAKVYDLLFAKTVQKETPLDILKKRFADGVISKEEYEEKKQILNADL